MPAGSDIIPTTFPLPRVVPCSYIDSKSIIIISKKNTEILPYLQVKVVGNKENVAFGLGTLRNAKDAPNAESHVLTKMNKDL